MGNLVWVYRLMFALALLALAAAIFMTVRNLPLAGGEQAKGTVVEQDKASGPQGGSNPIVEFKVGDKTHRFTGAVSSRPPQYEIGEKLPVRYVKDDPDKASIDKFQDLWLIQAVMFPVAIVLLLVGLGIRWFSRLGLGSDATFGAENESRGGITF